MWSANASSDKLRLWTKEQFAEKFGVAFNNSYDCITAMNGDVNGQVSAKVVDCWYQSGDIGCHITGHSTGPIRINYAVFLH